MGYFTLLSIAVLLVGGSAATEKVRAVCYYATWAYRYTGLGNFLVSNIDDEVASLCTHIIYAFIGIAEEGSIMLLDENFDKEGLKKFSAIRTNNPNLVSMVAVGGWNVGSRNFSIVAANETLRNAFASNVVAFLKTYNLLGLDVGWEYPSQRDDSTIADKENFIYFLEALKLAFADYGYVLSAAVSATQTGIDTSYNVTGLNNALDFINVMTYDLHGSWDGVTGANAPLYPQPTDTDSTAITVDICVKAWLSSGANATKLNIGLGNYGRAYTLASATVNGTGAALASEALASYAGPYAADVATWTYIEICSDLLNSTSSKYHWTKVNYNNSYVYRVRNTSWIGYDDRDTMSAKGAYAKNKGLGGVMFWALHGDDFQGHCGDGKWPLIKAAINGYNTTIYNCRRVNNAITKTKMQTTREEVIIFRAIKYLYLLNITNIL